MFLNKREFCLHFCLIHSIDVVSESHFFSFLVIVPRYDDNPFKYIAVFNFYEQENMLKSFIVYDSIKE